MASNSSRKCRLRELFILLIDKYPEWQAAKDIADELGFPSKSIAKLAMGREEIVITKKSVDKLYKINPEFLGI